MDRRTPSERAELLRIRQRESGSHQRHLERTRRRGLHPSTGQPRTLASPRPSDPLPRDTTTYSSTNISPFLSSRTSSLQRHRLRRQREDDPVGTVQDTINQLEAENSALQSVIDTPLPVLNSSSRSYSPLPDASMDAHVPRPKRRKLDADPLDESSAPIRYGYNGQIEPGRLQMRVATCTGGWINDADNSLTHISYPPENMLRNDKSVYCSRSDKCDLLFRHLGMKCFNLTKLMIKTPETGFTAPVQEGMVFASMSAGEVTSRARHYEIRDVFLPPPNPGPNASTAESRLARLMHPYLPTNRGARGSGATASAAQRSSRGHWEPRPPSRRTLNAEFPQQLAQLEPVLSEREQRAIEEYASLRHDGQSLLDQAELHAQGPYSVPVPPSPKSDSAPRCHCVVSHEPPADDVEELSSPEVLLDRQRRGRGTGGAESSSEDEDDFEEEEEEDDDGFDGSSRHRVPPLRRPRLRTMARRIEWSEKDAVAAESVVKPLEPLARFFIQRKKHVVVLTFDPPVAAKYVLLKLWSPQGRSNIDVQNVSIFGFAGPRWFPATKFV